MKPIYAVDMHQGNTYRAHAICLCLQELCFIACGSPQVEMSRVSESVRFTDHLSWLSELHLCWDPISTRALYLAWCVCLSLLPHC